MGAAFRCASTQQAAAQTNSAARAAKPRRHSPAALITYAPLPSIIFYIMEFARANGTAEPSGAKRGGGVWILGVG